MNAKPVELAVYQVVEVLFGVIIGCVSFAGSVVAFAKLQELVTGRPITCPGQQVMNADVPVLISLLNSFTGLAVAASASPPSSSGGHGGRLARVALVAPGHEVRRDHHLPALLGREMRNAE